MAAVAFEPGIRNLDQWRLLHFPKQDIRFHPGRRGTGPSTVRASDRRGPPHGLQIRGVLESHGYLERQAGARGYGGTGRDAMAREHAISYQKGIMRALQLAAPGERLAVLCLGAHCDDIE